MQRFDDHHPIAIFVWFLSVFALTMLTMHPVLLLTSLVCALAYRLLRSGRRSLRALLWLLPMFLLLCVLNPLLSHGGDTVLFFINQMPFTLEATVYGVCAAAMILATLAWFRVFSDIFTSERLLMLLGALSSKLALLVSMGLRYIPLFTLRIRRVTDAQRALGLYRDRSLVERVRGGVRIFSVLLTWGLEQGVVTADSMSARGYGVARRTFAADARIRPRDVWMILGALALCVGVCVPMATGDLFAQFYPVISFSSARPLSLLGYVCFLLLCAWPTAVDGMYRVLWRVRYARTPGQAVRWTI